MARHSALRKDSRGTHLTAAETAPVKLDRLIHERLRLGILSALAPMNRSPSTN